MCLQWSYNVLKDVVKDLDSSLGGIKRDACSVSVTYCILDVIRHTAAHAVREAAKLMTWGSISVTLQGSIRATTRYSYQSNHVALPESPSDNITDHHIGITHLRISTTAGVQTQVSEGGYVKKCSAFSPSLVSWRLDWLGHRLRRASRSRPTEPSSRRGREGWKAPLEISAAAADEPPRDLFHPFLVCRFLLCLQLSAKTNFENFTGHFVAVETAATSLRYRDCWCCAPVCAPLRSSRQQADRRAVRLDSCAPAVHAWHGRADPWIHLSSQDKVHPI